MTNFFETVTAREELDSKMITGEITLISERLATEILKNAMAEFDAKAAAVGELKQQLDTATDENREVITTEYEEAEKDLQTLSTMLEGSKKEHAIMDQLVTAYYDLASVDCSVLDKVKTDDAEKMIKSQQSKRSRAKSKVMTQENYRTMMVGAIAENLIRIHCNIERKSVGHNGGNAKDVNYTEEQLAAYKADRDKCAKEIRNLQSKKSIMKSKADFDEQSDAYQGLLVAEVTLKAIRDGIPTNNIAATTKEVVPDWAYELLKVRNDFLESVNFDEIQKTKASDLKSQLADIFAQLDSVFIPEDVKLPAEPVDETPAANEAAPTDNQEETIVTDNQDNQAE